LSGQACAIMARFEPFGNRRISGRGTMRALGYAWYIATNIFYVLVVVLVLTQLHERPESIIVPVLGLIYVRIHMLGVGLSSMTMISHRSLDLLHERVKKLIDPDYLRDPEVVADIEKKLTPDSGRLLINSIAMGLISLACLWKLFVALQAVNF